MKRQTTLFLCLLSLFYYSATAKCGKEIKSFKAGEELSYEISYKLGGIWIPAGSATFSVKNINQNGKNLLQLLGHGGTFGRMNKIFKVNDRYMSYVNPSNLLPYYFRRDVSEGDESFSTAVSFNRSSKIAKSPYGSYRITECTHDVISAIYWARCQSLQSRNPGSKLPVEVFLDDERFQLSVTYIGKETIETKYGNIETYKVSPTLIEGMVFDKNSKMYVWVTADKNQIPVRVSTNIIVGKIIVDLVDYKNLLNPSLLD